MVADQHVLEGDVHDIGLDLDTYWAVVQIDGGVGCVARAEAGVDVSHKS